jgi:hypothetical protein
MTTGAERTARRAGAALATAAVLTLLAGCHASPHRAASPTQTPVRQPIGSLSTSAPAPSTPTPQPPSPRTVADRELAAIGKRLPDGAISVAVLNTTTGASYRWGEQRGMWTGSVYKLLTLETLLMQRQRTGSRLTSYELGDITDMIERSRNRAGYRMYLAAGGAAALTAAARRLGLRHTRIGLADPALTTMSAPDGIVLLRQLVTPGPLSARSKAFVLHLMRNVQADQRWGAGVVADPDTAFANKNGWMAVGDDNDPSENDDGRWLVNSLGIVRVHGQRLLISVFTQHNPDCYTGIDLVEQLVRIIARAVLPAG